MICVNQVQHPLKIFENRWSILTSKQKLKLSEGNPKSFLQNSPLACDLLFPEMNILNREKGSFFSWPYCSQSYAIAQNKMRFGKEASLKHYVESLGNKTPIITVLSKRTFICKPGYVEILKTTQTLLLKLKEAFALLLVLVSQSIKMHNSRLFGIKFYFFSTIFC